MVAMATLLFYNTTQRCFNFQSRPDGRYGNLAVLQHNTQVFQLSESARRSLWQPCCSTKQHTGVSTFTVGPTVAMATLLFYKTTHRCFNFHSRPDGRYGNLAVLQNNTQVFQLSESARRSLWQPCCSTKQHTGVSTFRVGLTVAMATLLFYKTTHRCFNFQSRHDGRYGNLAVLQNNTQVFQLSESARRSLWQPCSSTKQHTGVSTFRVGPTVAKATLLFYKTTHRCFNFQSRPDGRYGNLAVLQNNTQVFQLSESARWSLWQPCCSTTQQTGVSTFRVGPTVAMATLLFYKSTHRCFNLQSRPDGRYGNLAVLQNNTRVFQLSESARRSLWQPCCSTTQHTGVSTFTVGPTVAMATLLFYKITHRCFNFQSRPDGRYGNLAVLQNNTQVFQLSESARRSLRQPCCSTTHRCFNFQSRPDGRYGNLAVLQNNTQVFQL